MEIQNDKPTVEVNINEAGGFGDISAGISIANYLSRDYDILLTFASPEAERKYMRMTNNNRLNFQIGEELVENNAIARVVPFIDSRVKYLPKKPTIVLSQYNGEPYLYGYADFSVVTGIGVEKNGRYFKLKPENAIRSGLYIKEISLDEIVSRSDISSKLNKVLAEKAGLQQEQVAEAYKKLAGKLLEDSGWVTSYNGVLGINGIIYDAINKAVSKSDSFAQKRPVVLNFIEETEFVGNTIPACQRNGFNIIHVKENNLEVVDKKSPVTVVNFGFVDDELYEQAVKSADLMNISAGDGSFSKGFSAFLKTGTPFLKYYNRDQREFIGGLVEILRDIEACEGSNSVTSDFFETFTTHEWIYKTCKGSASNKPKIKSITVMDGKTRKSWKESASDGNDYLKETAIKCRDNLPIENISRLFYDEQARQEFYKTASKIPENIRQRREEAGIKAAEVLPNAFDTTRYIIRQIIQGKTKNQILTELIGKTFEESAKEDMKAKNPNRLLKILKGLEYSLGYCLFKVDNYLCNIFEPLL